MTNNPSLLSNVKGAIFDLDGTLLDSMQLWENLARHYLEQRGISNISKDLREKVKTMSFDESARYLQTHYGLKETVPEINMGIQAMIESEYRDRIPLKPGVRSVLEGLYQKGVSLCIATANFPQLTKQAIRRLGIEHYFKAVLSSIDLGIDKDKPEFYLRVLEILGTPLQETLVFEDALHAIISAKKAGFPVVAVYDESARMDAPAIQAMADIYLKSFDEWEWTNV
jgi:HAD superfamily hydrolase (TIGR01509 family)